MESTETGSYEVIITGPAELGFYEVLDYLYDHYPISKAEKVADELRDAAKTLHYQPDRGAPESKLSHLAKRYRFILYQRTRRAGIKVIYYIDEAAKIVYVTDFFPTEMDATKIRERNK